LADPDRELAGIALHEFRIDPEVPPESLRRTGGPRLVASADAVPNGDPGHEVLYWGNARLRGAIPRGFRE